MSRPRRRRARRSCRTAAERSSRATASSRTTVRRRTRSWASSASARPPTRRRSSIGGGGRDPPAGAKLDRRARMYRSGGRPLLTAFELISTVASGSPEPSGLYSTQQSHAVIDRYLAAAHKAHALLILDIQPGHAEFMDEVRALYPYLEYPDVGVALDPEWKVPADQVPGKVIGSTDASVV